MGWGSSISQMAAGLADVVAPLTGAGTVIRAVSNPQELINDPLSATPFGSQGVLNPVNIINGVVPDVKAVDQSALLAQIAQQQQAAKDYMGMGAGLQEQAGQGYKATQDALAQAQANIMTNQQNAIGQAQGAIGQAQGMLGLGQGTIQDVQGTMGANQEAINRAVATNAANQAAINQAQASLGANQAAINQASGTMGANQAAINAANALNLGGYNRYGIDLMAQEAAGGGPAISAAQAQLQQGTDAAIKMQQAMANSGNASQMISGQKAAMENAATLAQQNALNATQIRAQMQQQGMAGLTQAAQQQAAQQAQNIGAQQAQTQLSQAGAGLQQQQTALAQGNAGLQQAQSGIAAQQAGLQQQQTQLAQGTAGLQQGLISQAQAGAGLQQRQADLQNQVTQNQLALANQQAGLYAQNLGAAQGYAGIGANLQGQAAQNQLGSSQLAQQPMSQTSQYRAQALGGMMNAAGGVATSLLSDESLKKDIRETSAYKFFRALDPKEFEYENANGENGKTPGKHIGVIAQQVEAAPGGKSMMKELPEGKAIDIASAVGSLMAHAAETTQKIDSLEEYFKSRKKGK